MTHRFAIMFSILFILASCCNESNSETEEESVIAKQKKLLVGKWVDKKEPTKFVLEFYDDETWKKISIHNDERIIKKGKYVLGNEHEVFIRLFGPQHFDNKDTINDFKTSIGAGLYYLYDTVLINEQEDYRIKYIKDK